MIKLNRYKDEFEKIYFEKVTQSVPKYIQEAVIKDCKDRFFINDFDDLNFRTLILMPFNTMKNVVESKCGIHLNLSKAYCDNISSDIYEEYKGKFASVASAQKKRKTMRVRMVEELGITVCPYCNRDYINARGEGAAGAQLDHFYSKEDYPYLSLSLYNLIPVCGNCNRIKSYKKGPFASVFDEDIDFTKELTFDYTNDFVGIEIRMNNNHEGLKNNINEMRIKYAYQIHVKEARELKELYDAYREEQYDEIRDVLNKYSITDSYIKHIIFGPKITEEMMKSKPLGKMLSDLHRKLGIYDK